LTAAELSYRYQDQQHLIRQCVAGDTHAFRELYNGHVRAMYNTCYRLVNNHADAEDVVQEAFTDAFRNLNRFDFNYTFGSWLKRIVINKSINHLRNKKRLPVSAVADGLPEVADEGEGFELTDIKAAAVKQAIDDLPHPYRMVMNLYLFEDYSQEEIGQLLGIAHGTVRVQYMRGRQKVLNALKEKNLYGR
jgi:RNA polymerase sigma factor (sigma-70 family)